MEILPPEVKDCGIPKETEEEKEAREHGDYEQAELDVDPKKIQVKKRPPNAKENPEVGIFSAGQVGPDFTTAYIGKRREGKSFCMRWLLYHLRNKIPRIYVFTTTKINGFWSQFCPDQYIFDGFRPGVMQAIRDEQMAIVEYMNSHPEEADSINPYVVIILEDCLSQDLHHAELLKDIFYNGRHLKMMLMISLQYAKGIPPGFRENCDMAFLFRLHSDTQIESVAENFLGMVKKKAAIELLESYVWKDQKTGDRQFLVVDASGNSDIDHMLYAGQAQEPPPFIFGCEEWWKDAPNKEWAGKPKKKTK